MTEVPFQANFVVVYDLFNLRGCGSLSLKLRYSAEFFKKKKLFSELVQKRLFLFSPMCYVYVSICMSV